MPCLTGSDPLAGDTTGTGIMRIEDHDRFSEGEDWDRENDTRISDAWTERPLLSVRMIISLQTTGPRLDRRQKNPHRMAGGFSAGFVVHRCGL